MQYLDKNRLTKRQYIEGLKAGDTVILSKALSLMESHLETDRSLGLEILEEILPETGNSIRIGITGAPGVGKSTFIESFGIALVDKDLKVAVLTVDPSSQRTKGSILGDKTRMLQLGKSQKAYIRPSAAGKALGGVASHIRESILVCEAAGYDVVLVETVGVGQSETTVKDMVDFFLLLMIAGAGDELQGIKKGIIEMADAVVITKADGENIQQAAQARSIFENALHLLSFANNQWSPPVLTCSAHNNQGISQVWDIINTFREQMEANGYWETQRQNQRITWMQQCVQLQIERQLLLKPDSDNSVAHLRHQVKEGKLLPARAAEQILTHLS